MSFQLHPRLAKGGTPLGTHGICTVLLKNNAIYPWFILIPHVNSSTTDLHHLAHEQYQLVSNSIYQLAQFIESNFSVQKVNIGAIGNIVPQLHIHLIGRTDSDPDWPAPAWGTQYKTSYQPEAIKAVQANFKKHFSDS